jgi:hypothetical protein
MCQYIHHIQVFISPVVLLKGYSVSFNVPGSKFLTTQPLEVSSFLVVAIPLFILIPRGNISQPSHPLPINVCRRNLLLHGNMLSANAQGVIRSPTDFSVYRQGLGNGPGIDGLDLAFVLPGPEKVALTCIGELALSLERLQCYVLV